MASGGEPTIGKDEQRGDPTLGSAPDTTGHLPPNPAGGVAPNPGGHFAANPTTSFALNPATSFALNPTGGHAPGPGLATHPPLPRPRHSPESCVFRRPAGLIRATG
ncbi:hypothetical protein ACFRNT_35725 [Streptomyces sp. NPDC056697]|uniref:hypothetical protein n=1 Tax=Streptomyces sp. NPDC056697 TaxID=3345915 RepID=UPI00369E1B17